MKSKQLLTDLEFHELMPFAQPLLVDQKSRIIRWMLKPGQQIGKHQVPGSPFYVVILAGRGLFAGKDGQETAYGPNTLLIFDTGEVHTVRALDEDLIFISFMREAGGMRESRIGGEIGRE